MVDAHITLNLGGAFEDDFPSIAVLHPILALAHLIAEIVAAVILVEGHNDHIVLAGIAKNADIGKRDIDRFFAGVDRAFLGRPRSEILRAIGKLP